jgi:hypothetical protein
LLAHKWDGVLATVDHATQVDGDEVIEGLGGNVLNSRIFASDANTDIIVQDIDPSPALHTGIDHGPDLLLVHHICLARRRLPSFLGDKRDRLCSRSEVSVDDQYLCAFSGKHERRCPTVPNCSSGPFALSRPDNDRHLVLQPHVISFCREGV